MTIILDFVSVEQVEGMNLTPTQIQSVKDSFVALMQQFIEEETIVNPSDFLSAEVDDRKVMSKIIDYTDDDEFAQEMILWLEPIREYPQ